MEKYDCFALNDDNKCICLKIKNCSNCKFYRNDLSSKKIEQDVFNHHFQKLHKRSKKCLN